MGASRAQGRTKAEARSTRARPKSRMRIARSGERRAIGSGLDVSAEQDVRVGKADLRRASSRNGG